MVLLLLAGYGMGIALGVRSARLARRVLLLRELRPLVRDGSRVCLHCWYSVTGLQAVNGVWRCPECGLATAVY